MSRRAACSTRSCSGPARCAASSAAAGSMISRTSVSRPRKVAAVADPPAATRARRDRAGSSDSRGRTRVPVRGRDTTRPLAARTLIASRITPRLAPHCCRRRHLLARADLAAHDAAADGVDDPAVQARLRIARARLGDGRRSRHGAQHSGSLRLGAQGALGEHSARNWALTRPERCAYSSDNLDHWSDQFNRWPLRGRRRRVAARGSLDGRPKGGGNRHEEARTAVAIAIALRRWSARPPQHAQVTTGTIVGTVKDQQGAAVPGATRDHHQPGPGHVEHPHDGRGRLLQGAVPDPRDLRRDGRAGRLPQARASRAWCCRSTSARVSTRRWRSAA